MARIVPIFLVSIALALTSVGAWIIYPPAGLITLGLLLLLELKT